MPIHFTKKHHHLEWWVLGLIMLVAFVFRFQHIQSIPPGLYPDEAMNGNNAIYALENNDYKVYYPENNGREGLFIGLQAQSLRIFGYHPWALRVVSAFFGTLTVLGLYLLTRKLFNWEIAAISSFFLATSFWHTLFSRLGFRAIMAPFFIVWALYFLWRGKTSARLYDFALAGLAIGLGMYTYIAFRVAPLIILLALGSYWYAVRKDFAHEKYLHIRHQLVRGFTMMLLVSLIVALPLGIYYMANPGDFLGRTAQVSVFSSGSPLQSLIVNTGKTLGMFNIVGDSNWRHNFSGRPQLFWPVGVFFVIGFLRSFYKLYKTKKTHGHFAPAQVALLSWFFLGLLPVVFSNEGLPHALRAIMIAPVCMIFAGEGLWWLYDFSKKWYRLSDMHDVTIHGFKTKEGTLVATFAVCALLTGIMLSEYRTYFQVWAKTSDVAAAYSEDYVVLGELLNGLPRDIKKYVVVNGEGTMVSPPGGGQEVAMPAQTVMFITDTWTPEKQQAKNIYYVKTPPNKASNVAIFYLNQNP